MVRVIQTSDELNRQLKEQLDLLSELADLYDCGKVVAAKSMATTIRVLLHDTPSSKSLLGQLQRKKSVDYYDTADVRQVSTDDSTVSSSFSALTAISMGISGRSGEFTPYLDNLPGYEPRFVDFDTFWNKEIFYDQNKNSFSRKEVVLYVANQDGGSHVDPGLDKKYAELARRNSLGWRTSLDGKVWQAIERAELASIRQVAHELLKTLDPNYQTPVVEVQGLMIGGAGFTLRTWKDPYLATKRKDPCPCGSGKKYKRCHGE